MNNILGFIAVVFAGLVKLGMMGIGAYLMVNGHLLMGIVCVLAGILMVQASWRSE